MATKYTTQQKQAMETLDRSVLVAAAAGSGKTAVLVQRIINIILEGRADVDEMLIVTFTKAAASEMKMKLSRAIKKKMKESPEDRIRLQKQLDKLYKAYISTYDSFALRVVKEFFYKLDMEPKFSAIDEADSGILKNYAVDMLFEEAFERDDLITGGSFREFLRLYSSDRSEKDVKERIIKTYDALRTMPDYFEWAHETAKDMIVDPDKFAESKLCEDLRESCRRMLSESVKGIEFTREVMENAGFGELFEQKLLAEYDLLHELAEEVERTDLDEDFIGKLPTKFAQIRVSKSVQADWDEVKDYVSAARDRYKNPIGDWLKRYTIGGLEQRIKEQNAAYEYTEYYINLLEEFEKRYDLLKRKEGAVDFGDMSHFAAQILKDDSVSEVLRNRFKYIFVDEYQDTNNIQEALIARVARPDNVFKVGDVKQSIYRFRNAEPAIFERTYRDYKRDDNHKACSIDLNMNFRCNPKSIEYINKVFEDEMEGYDNDARLYPGLDFCPDEYDFEPEVHLLIKGVSGGDEEEAEGAGAGYGESAEESLRDLTLAEAEAKHIAGIIEDLIGTEFYDTLQKTVRKVEPKDIAILANSTKNIGPACADALQKINVQAYVEASKDIFDALEIQLVLSLFMTIDNFKRDVPLIATLHSDIFGFSAEELGYIRAEYTEAFAAEGVNTRRKPYWMAAKWYAKSGSDEALRERLQAACDRLEEWKNLSTMMPVSDFIWKVIVDSGLYAYVGAMYNGGMRQANLRLLVEKASTFAADSIVSLGDFIRYLDVMKDKQIENAQANIVGKDDNVVRIMTIHKSKGLEYPFVIVARIGAKFMGDSVGKHLAFDTGLGVSLAYVDPQKRYWRSTIKQQLIHEKNRDEEYRENLRVLYVAMTRVRNKLYLVGSVTEKEENEIRNGIANKNKFAAILGENAGTQYNRLLIKPLEEKDSWERVDKVKSILNACDNDAARKEGEESELGREVARRLDYEYPDEKLKLKAKYSVSELRREAAGKGMLRHPDSIDESEAEAETSNDEMAAIRRNTRNKKRRANSSDIGIAYHRIMEQIDFAAVIKDDGSVDEAYIKSVAEDLLARKAIDENAYKDVELSNISAFFKVDLGKRAVKACREGKLKKEKPFTLVYEKDGQDVLVQGVADCVFEEDGELVLVDYKSSFLRKDKAREEEIARIKSEYAVQIAIYGEALKQGTGKVLKEAYLYLFLYGEALDMM